MSCALSASRVFFHIFNVLFVLIGVCTLGVGIYGVCTGKTFGESGNISMIAVGLLLIALFILGCFGVQRKSFRLMCIFSIILGVLFILQLINLIRMYTTNFDDSVSTILDIAWSVRKADPTTMMTLETTFECCGVNGYEDYLKDKETIPKSCFALGLTTSDLLRYDTGCQKAMVEVTKEAAKALITGNWIALIVEGGVLVFSIILAYSYRQRQSLHQVVYAQKI